jgi:coproporphyrinogen III oxidase-like Fe-S oxidoreductase
MGPYPLPSGDIIGLGPGAISHVQGVLKQNERATDHYLNCASKNQWSPFRGHTQTDAEKSLHRFYEQSFTTGLIDFSSFPNTTLPQWPIDGLFTSEREHSWRITELGREGMKLVLEDITRTILEQQNSL